MAGGMQLAPYYRAQLDPRFLCWYAQHFAAHRMAYVHWTAGPRHLAFAAYHRVVLEAPRPRVVVNRDVMRDGGAHTYCRNTGSFGVSVACMQNATTERFGPQAPTPGQLALLRDDLVKVCLQHRIPVSCLMSHQEAADCEDSYSPHAPYGPMAGGCERWDWWCTIDPQSLHIYPTSRGEWRILKAAEKQPGHVPFMDWLRFAVAVGLQKATEQLWRPM